MSLPEVVLWQQLRRQQLAGMKFRRQHPIGPYVLDFYCADCSLAVEVDGGSHDFETRALHDERRDAWLAAEGVRVLRFLASDVLDDSSIEAVLTAIKSAAGVREYPAR